MSVDDRQFVIDLFDGLHLALGLGIGELLAALRAVEGGWVTADRDDLKQVLVLIWCHSRTAEAEFEAVWSENHTDTDVAADQPSPEEEQKLVEEKGEASELSTDDSPPAAEVAAPTTDSRSIPWPDVPVLPPDISAIQPTWPTPRRAMVYAWRYLRRPTADGPRTELDIAATIDRAARQGFFLEPVLCRRERNDAHLVLLIDRNGSMVPFHQFVRALAEAARDESDIDRIDILYFHNVPSDRLYLDPYLTDPIRLEHLLRRCLSDTAVAIVSDAGAARGRRQLERIRSTAEFLVRLRQQTSLIAWLNPMPQRRWRSTSAQVIAHMISMFPLTADGLSNAIDVLRGQPLAQDLVL